MKKLDDFLFTKIDATGLAVFRIAYALILFLEISQLDTFSPLIYDIVPYLVPGEFHAAFAFGFWKLALIFLALGLYTRWISIINYILTVCVTSSLEVYEYHVFYTYATIGFLLIFMPVSQVFSLDKLRKNLNNFNLRSAWNVNDKVFRVYYLAPVFTALGFVYFDSTFYKFSSPMWLNGLGMWLPANLPIASWNEMVILSDYEWVSKSLGYLVIVFELIFMFTFWYKPLRIPLLIIGVGLHVGILVEFPIPWFALAAVGCYILMVPVSWWNLFKTRSEKTSLYFYYNENNSLSTKISLIINHFDMFRKIKGIGISSTSKEFEGYPYATTASGIKIEGVKTYIAILKHMIWTRPIAWLVMLPGISHLSNSLVLGAYPLLHESNFSHTESEIISTINTGTFQRKTSQIIWYGILSLFVLTQIIISTTSPIMIDLLADVFASNRKNFYKCVDISSKTADIAIDFLGLTHHPVFGDYHFDNYNHILRIAHIDENEKETNLPVINEKGMPDTYVRGAFWVNYTFRVSSSYQEWAKYHTGISRYARYWIGSNRKKFDRQRFNIYVSTIELPKSWEKGYLQKTIKSLKWEKAATLEINNTDEKFVPLIPDLEKTKEGINKKNIPEYF